MALLTREERQSLDKSGRRALRRERRAARSDKRQSGDGVRLDLHTLRNRAVVLITDMAADSIPGPEKMDEVLDELVDDADDFLVWTWAGPGGMLLELVDGPALRALVRVLIRPHVEAAYRALRDNDKLDD